MEMLRGVEAMKTAVRHSLEKEEEWIKDNYDSGDEFCVMPIPPMIFRRCHNHVYSGLTYFRVRKHDDDDLFLKQIDMRPWIIKSNKRMRSIIYDQLVILSLRCADAPLERFKKLSDTRFFDSAIHAAATLAFKLYTTEELIRFGQQRTHIHQLNNLWKMFAIRGEKGCAIDEVCKSIVHKKIHKENYSLVTEKDLYDMCSTYDTLLQWPELFQRPYKTFISPEKKPPMHDKIKEVVSKMELPTRSKVEVDEYTRFLINFVRQNTREVQELRDKHIEMIDKEGLHALNPGLLPFRDEPSSSSNDITFRLKDVLDGLTYWRRDYIREQLVSATMALFLVVGESLIVANEVLEIIEVAELRRIALGSRFINRNHLIWAFYECGFGLPPEIRKNLDLPIAEDHPPYVIYLASKELATSSATSGFEVGCAGKKKLLLEHFVFSILYAKNIMVDKNQVKEMEEHFKTFVEVVALDGINRPQVQIFC